MPFFNVVRNRLREFFQRTINHITQPLQDITFQLILFVDDVTGDSIKDWGDSHERWLTGDQLVRYEQIYALSKREQDS